jgi:hypothetical protein
VGVHVNPTLPIGPCATLDATGGGESARDTLTMGHLVG